MLVNNFSCILRNFFKEWFFFMFRFVNVILTFVNFFTYDVNICGRSRYWSSILFVLTFEFDVRLSDTSRKSLVYNLCNRVQLPCQDGRHRNFVLSLKDLHFAFKFWTLCGFDQVRTFDRSCNIDHKGFQYNQCIDILCLCLDQFRLLRNKNHTRTLVVLSLGRKIVYFLSATRQLWGSSAILPCEIENSCPQIRHVSLSPESMNSAVCK